jgi:hypothetical protein
VTRKLSRLSLAISCAASLILVSRFKSDVLYSVTCRLGHPLHGVLADNNPFIASGKSTNVFNIFHLALLAVCAKKPSIVRYSLLKARPIFKRITGREPSVFSGSPIVLAHRTVLHCYSCVQVA